MDEKLSTMFNNFPMYCSTKKPHFCDCFVLPFVRRILSRHSPKATLGMIISLGQQLPDCLGAEG